MTFSLALNQPDYYHHQLTFSYLVMDTVNVHAVLPVSPFAASDSMFFLTKIILYA